MAAKQTNKKRELKAFFLSLKGLFCLAPTSFGETSVELSVASQLPTTPYPTNRTPPAVATWLNVLVYFTGLL